MAKQDQDHPAAGRPLPACLMVLLCQECDSQVIWKGDFNTQQLASVLCRVRREHAAATHEWQPRMPRGAQ